MRLLIVEDEPSLGRQLRATLESTADGILVVNDAGHIENFNRHFAELWRLPAVTPGPAEASASARPRPDARLPLGDVRTAS